MRKAAANESMKFEGPYAPFAYRQNQAPVTLHKISLLVIICFDSYVFERYLDMIAAAEYLSLANIEGT